jgi:hypothetical protein
MHTQKSVFVDKTPCNMVGNTGHFGGNRAVSVFRVETAMEKIM